MSTITAPARASARLGGSLRAVLLGPMAGFEAAFKTAERRERAGLRPAEGFSPYVLAGLGGAALMSLWLKIGGLTGLRDVVTPAFRWDLFAGALVGGVLLALAAQALWGVAGRWLGKERTRPQARELRMVWGAAALPQALGLVVLLPLDLLIVGSQTYTTDKLTDPLSTMWAAMSIAIGVSLLIWSFFLFARGCQVALRAGWLRALGAVLSSLLVVTLIGGLLFLGLRVAAGAGT